MLEATVQAVHLAEALVGQVVRGALAGDAVVTVDDQRLVEVCLGDEVVQRVVVQVAGARDVPVGETLCIADVDQLRALLDKSDSGISF